MRRADGFASFDVDLPIECDDEYWINPDPNLAFKQPAGKPSKIVFFNCVMRLAQIHAFALRTIVCFCVLFCKKYLST